MINILVVEKEQSLRQEIKFNLESQGFLVIDVNNLNDAICAVNSIKCALVISDISNVNFKDISLHSSANHIPVITMTDFPNSSAAIKEKSIYGDCIFEKPFSTQLLISKVYDVLNSEISNEYVA